jgi:AcrR family transcriptional regulator
VSPDEPAPYQLGRRRADIDEGRRRILDGALLAESTHHAAFTVEAVPKRADVACATVYYQFGSKTGLLEAVCDSLAERGGMTELATAFTTPDPDDALLLLVAAFARLWDTDRHVMRRLRALAALDPDVAAVISGRDERRRHALRTLLERRSDVTDLAHLLRVAHMLTSFETYDTLLTPHRRPSDAVPTIVEGHRELARAVARSTASDAARVEPTIVRAVSDLIADMDPKHLRRARCRRF